jgi:hypothetical protein
VPQPPIHTLVLVEGASDAAAIRALAGLLKFDLDLHKICLRSADGVTNFAHVLSDFIREYPAARLCGLYDSADERHVRGALIRANVPIRDGESPELFGFFACTADLEDELIRALGTDAVERVIEIEGELSSLRRFQAMPEHRHSPAEQQLRRFLGTRATRKIRLAKRLVETLDLDRLPCPLAGLAARLLETGRSS